MSRYTKQKVVRGYLQIKSTVVYETPSDQGNVLGEVNYGEYITSEGSLETPGWTRVRDDQGNPGYIKGDIPLRSLPDYKRFKIAGPIDLACGIFFLLVWRISIIVLFWGLFATVTGAGMVLAFIMQNVAWKKWAVKDFRTPRQPRVQAGVGKPIYGMNQMAGANLDDQAVMIHRDAEQQGFNAIPAVELYMTPNRAEMMNMMSMASKVRDKEALAKGIKWLIIDSVDEIENSMRSLDPATSIGLTGTMKPSGLGSIGLEGDVSYTLVAPNARIFVEIRTAVPGKAVSSKTLGKMALKLIIRAENPQMAKDIARIAIHVFGDNPFQQMKWDYVQKLFGISQQDAINAWTRILQ
nr:hypothetical protein [Candidatus Sigynarchaeota archaeon]